MPMMVVPSEAIISSGGYVASRAIIRFPFDRIDAGTMAAIEASFDWVGMPDEDVVGVVDLAVVLVVLFGLLLLAAARTGMRQIAATGAPLRNPRMNTY